MDETISENLEEGLEDVSLPFRQSTTPDNVPLTAIGSFGSEEEAQNLLEVIFVFAREFGRLFDLGSLDGITIADDFAAAVGAIDRGYPGMRAAVPSNDEFGGGGGMTLPVLRDGFHKSYVVLGSALVRPLTQPDDPFYQRAVHTLIHELGHVHDQGLQRKCLPGFYGSKISDPQEILTQRFALSAWDEYAASRLSADWGAPDYLENFQVALLAMLESIFERSEEAKARFCFHRDISRTISDLYEVFGTFLVRASYVTGHLDGIERSLDDELSELASALRSTASLGNLWNQCNGILRQMFEIQGHWKGTEVFLPLKSVCLELFLLGGLTWTAKPHGYHVTFVSTNGI